jgi:hypothetical protein
MTRGIRLCPMEWAVEGDSQKILRWDATERERRGGEANTPVVARLPQHDAASRGQRPQPREPVLHEQRADTATLVRRQDGNGAEAVPAT